MRSEKVRLAGLQSVITITSAAVAFIFAAPLVAGSIAFGGCVSILGTLFLAWRFATGGRQETQDAVKVLRHAYRTAMERFMLAVFLLSIGFGILKLAPVWLLAGFISGQLAWLAVPVWMRLKK
jgi:hypothetical protein